MYFVFRSLVIICVIYCNEASTTNKTFPAIIIFLLLCCFALHCFSTHSASMRQRERESRHIIQIVRTPLPIVFIVRHKITFASFSVVVVDVGLVDCSNITHTHTFRRIHTSIPIGEPLNKINIYNLDTVLLF